MMKKAEPGRGRLIFSNKFIVCTGVIVSVYFRRLKTRVRSAVLLVKFCVSRLALVAGVVIFALGCEKPPIEVLTVEMDWSSYEQSLKEHVTEATQSGIKVNLVDYNALRQDSGFIALADQLAKASIEFSSDKDKMAFYINAYNYYAIKIVLDKEPENSIRDIGNVVQPVWKRTVGQIAGEDVSLDTIEHEVLRPMGDPRIHFSIVCASLSCPNLRPEAYTGDKLEDQLEDQTSSFVNDKTKGAVIRQEELYLSNIFDWFEEDFSASGGVLAFIRRYRNDFDRYQKYQIIEYRWELNALKQ